MAITPKQEEQLQELKKELLELGTRVHVNEAANLSYVLKSSKLKDSLRAAIYITSLHETDEARSDWDKKINVKDLMENLRENI